MPTTCWFFSVGEVLRIVNIVDVVKCFEPDSLSKEYLVSKVFLWYSRERVPESSLRVRTKLRKTWGMSFLSWTVRSQRRESHSQLAPGETPGNLLGWNSFCSSFLQVSDDYDPTHDGAELFTARVGGSEDGFSGGPSEYPESRKADLSKICVSVPA